MAAIHPSYYMKHNSMLRAVPRCDCLLRLLICAKDNRILRQLVATAAFVALSTSGCSRDPNLPTTAVVKGNVTYQNKPVKNARITFHPLGKVKCARGVSDDSGRFRLSTFGTGDGAVI